MLTRDKWDQCKRLLDDGLSQRAIRALTGLSRSTIRRIDRGQAPRPSKCRGCHPRPPTRGRCTQCGALVNLPCCACCDELRATPGTAGPEITAPPRLELRPLDAARLEEVMAWQRIHGKRGQPAEGFAGDEP